MGCRKRTRWIVFIIIITITCLSKLWIQIKDASRVLLKTDLGIHSMSLRNESLSSSLDSHLQVLSNELFCPLKHPSDQGKYHNILRDVYHYQFSSPCSFNEPNVKFLIFHDSRYYWGTFSSWENHHIPLLTLALATGRKFVWYPSKQYRYLRYDNGANIPKLCHNKTGRECFLKPISNCDDHQRHMLLQAMKKRQISVFNLNQSSCTWLVNQSIVKKLMTFSNEPLLKTLHE